MFTVTISVLNGGMKMKGFKLYYLISTIFVLIITSPPPFAAADTPVSSNDFSISETGWKTSKKSHGVIHYTQPIKGCEMSAYKGVFIIDRPIETILSLVKDVTNHSSWVTFCSSSAIIKKNSESDAIQYYNFDVPWPFLNRDIVVHCIQKTDPATGTITIESNAVKSANVPLKKNHLRITDAKHRWVLEEIEPGKTRVTFISMTNVEGAAPNALKRLISQIIPATSLEKLLALSMKTSVPSQPTYIAKSNIANKK
jgi:hypothetical protein